ncbi:MAG: hypothetical protein ACWA5K_09605 [bacterium]
MATDSPIECQTSNTYNTQARLSSRLTKMLAPSRSSIAPIGVSISLDHSDSSTWIDNICRELSMYQAFVGRRPARSLWLKHGKPGKSKLEHITGIIFRLSRDLNRCCSTGHVFAAELEARYLDKPCLQLMAGLGFNTLAVSGLTRPNVDPQCFNIIRQFRQSSFTSLIAMTSAKDIRGEQALATFEKLAHIGVDKIVAICDAGSLPLDQRLVESASQHGFSALHQRPHPCASKLHEVCLVAESLHPSTIEPTAKPVLDWVGLGPGAIGTLDGTHYQNHLSLHDYANAVTSGLLPVRDFR